MTLSLVGVLPVSGISLGIGLVVPMLEAEITELELDISRLGIALTAQGAIALSPPNLAQLEASLAALAQALSSLLNPTSIVTVNAQFNLELGLQLGIVDLALAGALAGQATIQAGLAAPGIAAWCYSGSASGLAGVANQITGPWERGIFVATESTDSWGKFGAGVNVGPSKTAPAGGAPTLTKLGQLGGDEIVTGLVSLTVEVDLIVAKLRGLKAQLEQQVDVTLGINLPDLSELIDALADLASDVQGLLDNLLTVNVDLGAELSGLQARLSYLLGIVADLSIQLSAGGLALWSYSGDGTLGPDIAATIAGGVPGGSGSSADIRALALGCAEPSVWANFSQILGGV